MDWFFILGLVLFIAVIPLKNYLFGFKRRRSELYQAYLGEPNNGKYKVHSNHSRNNCGH